MVEGHRTVRLEHRSKSSSTIRPWLVSEMQVVFLSKSNLENKLMLASSCRMIQLRVHRRHIYQSFETRDSCLTRRWNRPLKARRLSGNR